MIKVHHMVIQQASSVYSCQSNTVRKQNLKDNTPPQKLLYDQLNIYVQFCNSKCKWPQEIKHRLL
jgi:hypothetical protein